MLAYLERAPRKDPPPNLSITAYLLEGAEESFSGYTETSFAGYAIEEVEVAIPRDDSLGWSTGHEPEPEMEAKSVAAVVFVGEKIDLKVVVAGIVLSQKALAADELERESKKRES
jgi:hypothetical protein